MRSILSACFFFAAGSSLLAQPTLTSANMTTIGNSQTYFDADSLAPSLDAVAGANVTWDYSAMAGYGGSTTVNDIVDIAVTGLTADYPKATMADTLGQISVYRTNFANNVASYGFSFTEVSLGRVKFLYNTDTLVQMTYPFTFGDNYTDNVAGDAVTGFGTYPYSGAVTVTADGYGTLNMPTLSRSNVLRVKVVENAIIQQGIPFGNLAVTRTQYLYYDHVSSNFPVLIWAEVSVPDLSLVIRAVYSADPLPANVSVNELPEASFAVYPNPADNQIMLKEANEFDRAVIMDAQGRIIRHISKTALNHSIDISNLSAGTYIVRCFGNQTAVNHKFMKQ